MPRPEAEPITSLENPHVRLARSLLGASGRRRHQAFLVEGLRHVEAAAEMVRPQFVLYTPQFGRADARERGLLRSLRSLDVPVRLVDERVLAHVTDTVTPQGIVAIVPLPDEHVAAETKARGATAGLTSPVLVLDGIGDPGNAGTLLRSAAGAGVVEVLATKGTVDLFSPKVVRAAAGAHFHLALATDQSWDAVRQRLPEGCSILIAEVHDGRLYWEVDWTRPTALVLGNEAHGPSGDALATATGRVTIPVEHVESLNVGVAGSIILFEAKRQWLRRRET